ncbi:hypothetical protein [Commensalibacter melissae]|uniref:hypothetical protein n=1 Tax=Commensalibacter melissae TaxID=2070537 RepID=UPI0012D93018|nr:hypothetical protein [Commensalibacter melissae]MUG77232.1 hypothetical protein [Commensalibacter melissae]
MFTGIITAAWRGFGFDHGDGFIELRLGFLSFALCKGKIWSQVIIMNNQARKLLEVNRDLQEKVKQNGK